MFVSTDYTLFGSSVTTKQMVSKLKDFEYHQAVICDDKLYGVLEFYYACKKAEIKPIVSLRSEINGVNVILVSRNFRGFKNLSMLSEYENISKDVFSQYKENLTVIIEPMFYKEDNAMDLRDFLIEQDVSVYAGEIVPKNISEKLFMSTIKKLDLRSVPSEISTQLTKEDYRKTISLKAVGQKRSYDQVMLAGEVSPEDFIKDKKYYSENYSRESLLNLKEIFDSCVDDYEFGDPTPPNFKFTKEVCIEEGIDENTSESELFAYLSRKGLEDRLKLVDPSKHDEYKQRLEKEIDIINQMKFPGYMLIVWEFVIAAKRLFIPVGPGRGSAAGSLVAYCLYITDIDPMPYGLLFERFLNPERISMPDIDMDFCQSRRQEVLDYVSKKYGAENVAQIITFGKMGGKASIKDAARIHGYGGGDRMSKAIPETPGIKLDEAYEQNKAEIDEILDDNMAKRVWNHAHKLEGLTRNLGVHAAGVVISNENVAEKCPIDNVKGTRVVQFEGKYLEDVDLIKFDFLGLKTLSVIDMAVKMVKQNKGVEIDFRSMVKYDDEKVFEYITTGQTGGMFQIESEGMQDLCRRLKPDCFEDLIAILALYRPGPMESGMLDDFIDRKQGRAEITYFHDEFVEPLKPILEPTYGVIVYQEQVMQIVQTIGGFSLGGADLVRRAMGKKIKAEMDKLKGEFAEGGVKKGYKKEHCEELFDLIVKFAGYGFNKSHSAAYALITYYTAVLKTYHPHEFMASLMNFDYDNHDKLITYINATKQMDIEIEAPDVNSSTEFFSVRDEKIVYGLRALKSAGVNVTSVIKKREKDGPYKDIKDFLFRSRPDTPKLNKSAFVALYSSGALDKLCSRDFLYEISDKFMKVTKVSQFSFLDDYTDEDIFSKEKNIERHVLDEKAFMGHIYTSPFERIQKEIDQFDILTPDEFSCGKNETIFWIEEIEERISKKGNKFASVFLIDINKNTHRAVMFSSTLESLKKSGIDISKPVIIDCVLKDEGSLIINDIIALSKNRLLKSFPKKVVQPKVAAVKEEVKKPEAVKLPQPETQPEEEKKVKEVFMNDFDSLFDLNGFDEVIVVNDNNQKILRLQC